jgi:hypothetical protein
VTLREHSYPRSSETAYRSPVHLVAPTSLQGIFAPDRAQALCSRMLSALLWWLWWPPGVAARWRWSICRTAEAIAGRSAACFFRTSENLLVLRKEVAEVQGIRQRRHCW